MKINNNLRLEDVQSIIENNGLIEISEQTKSQIEGCYGFLESFAKDKVIYGINTGFGPMAQWRIDDDHLKELQYNIIRSH